jgi:hypothetical protein
VSGARGYEVAVFRASSDGGEPVLVTRATVPGDARGWTPSVEECIERGERYRDRRLVEVGEAVRGSGSGPRARRFARWVWSNTLRDQTRRDVRKWWELRGPP